MTDVTDVAGPTDRPGPTGVSTGCGGDLLTVIERRLTALRDEYALGERGLAELAARRDELTQTMLRIAGAIRVLEELTATAPGEGGAPGAGPAWKPGG